MMGLIVEGTVSSFTLAPCQRGPPESGTALPLALQKSVPTLLLAVSLTGH